MTPDEVAGKRVTVVGAARSGLACAELLSEAGASVYLSEYKEADNETLSRLNNAGVMYEFGGHTPRALDADFIAISPGVPSNIPLLVEAQEKQIPIYSEIEVASWFCKAPIVAITGSNGKTTTTSLIGHVFSLAGVKTHVAGNIGKAFSEIVRATTPNDIVVLEVSSFQLDHIDSFRPRVSVLLNIAPDHLDRYNNRFENYAQSKFRIFENQTRQDVLIYNYDDTLIRGTLLAKKEAEDNTPQLLAFSVNESPPAGMWLDQNHLTYTDEPHQHTQLMTKDDLALPGIHNVYNAMATALASKAMQVDTQQVRKGLSQFEGVPHRLELVRVLNGVKYINDSKATNVDAVWYALGSFSEKIILIAGGRDKGNDYTSIKPLIKERVRVLIALGESAEKVRTELGIYADECLTADSLEDAVKQASQLAQEGEVVLLSPACSSFDMFTNYEERGAVFKAAVAQVTH